MRGDVHRLRAPRDVRGHEQRGARYAIVVQSDLLLELSTWLVAPTSTGGGWASFHPSVMIADQATHVLVEQTMAVDPQRLGERVGSLSPSELSDIDAALRLVLGLR